MKLTYLERKKILFRFLKDNNAYSKFLRNLKKEGTHNVISLKHTLNNDANWEMVICQAFKWPKKEYKKWYDLNDKFMFMAEDMEIKFAHSFNNI